MKSKIWVDIIINKFENHPNEVSKLVGISPSKISVKGDLYKSPNGKEIIEPFNEWILNSGCDTSVDVEEQIRILLLKLKPFRQEFLEICDKFPPFVKIVIHIFRNESYPYIGIDDNQIIKDMGIINSTFGIDYSIYDDEIDL